MNQGLIESLTPREREVLVLIAEGKSIVEIAQQLHRSQKTIESHRLALGRKLRVSNRVELAKIAIAAGLVALSSYPPIGGPDEVSEQTRLELDWLHRINHAVYNATGRGYLQRFCNAMSLLPGVEICSICTTDTLAEQGDNPMNRVVLAIATRGEPGEAMRYHATDTPCSEVIKHGEYLVERGVAEAFPDDDWLKQVGAESYFGMQAINEAGEAVGGVSLISSRPLEHVDVLREVVGFFAPRLAAVLQTCLEIERLQAMGDRRSNLPLLIDPTTVAALTMAGFNSTAGIALAQVLRRVNHLAGVGFLQKLIEVIAETFGVQYVGVCKVDAAGQAGGSRFSSLFSLTPLGQGDPFSYPAADTPCDDVLDQGLVSIPRNAAQMYPDDAMFQREGIESYVGVRLGDRENPRGVAWLIDARPFKDIKSIEVVLSYFAPRIAAELAEIAKHEQVMQTLESLESMSSDRKGG